MGGVRDAEHEMVNKRGKRRREVEGEWRENEITSQQDSDFIIPIYSFGWGKNNKANRKRSQNERGKRREREDGADRGKAGVERKWKQKGKMGDRRVNTKVRMALFSSLCVSNPLLLRLSGSRCDGENGLHCPASAPFPNKFHRAAHTHTSPSPIKPSS